MVSQLPVYIDTVPTVILHLLLGYGIVDFRNIQISPGILNPWT